MLLNVGGCEMYICFIMMGKTRREGMMGGNDVDIVLL